MRYPQLWGEDLPAVLKWIRAVIASREEASAEGVDPALDGLGYSPVLWMEAVVPLSYYSLDGSLKFQTDAPDLFARIGTRFNTGGEPGNMFRLPNIPAPVADTQWIAKK